MAYFIIGFVLLLIIAPMFAILPSARQKKQMRFRKEAMGQGIGVELTRIDDPIPDRDKYLSSTGKPLAPILGVAAYSLTRPKSDEWRISPRIDWILERKAEISPDLPGHWHWHKSRPAEMSREFEDFLVRELPSLPGDVVKIQEVNDRLVIYWHELSNEEGFASLVAFLRGCIAISPDIMHDDLGPI